MILSATLLSAVLITQEPQKIHKSPPDFFPHTSHGFPLELRHDRAANSAQEQRAWDDAVFAYYRVRTEARSLTLKHVPAVSPVLDTPAKRLYRTRLRALADHSPSFAQSVPVTEIGCGTSCFSLGLLNVDTGQTFLVQDVSSANVFVRAEYYLDSRALHVMGYVGRETASDRWYVWEGGGLHLVSAQPLPQECFDVGEYEQMWHSAACHFVADTAKPELQSR